MAIDMIGKAFTAQCGGQAKRLNTVSSLSQFNNLIEDEFFRLMFDVEGV